MPRHLQIIIWLTMQNCYYAAGEIVLLDHHPKKALLRIFAGWVAAPTFRLITEKHGGLP